MLSPPTSTDPQHFFRTFSGSNLLEIKALKSSIDADEANTKSISYSTYLASFNNLTFFQIFWKNLEFMELLVQQVKKDSLNEQDDDEKSDENIIIR